MSGYNIEYFLEDYAKRTMENLEIIEHYSSTRWMNIQGELLKEKKAYEVTQLINSLLGLVLIPMESLKKENDGRITYKNELRKKAPEKYDEVMNLLERCKDERRIGSTYSSDQKEIYVDRFVKHLRNAIAHEGIAFWPVNEGKIEKVFFYDRNPQNASEEFCVKLSVGELRCLVENIVSLFCQFPQKNNKIGEKQQKYDDRLREYQRIMERGIA